jgi:hypothetical protein
MSTTATLKYVVSIQGPITQAALVAALTAIPLSITPLDVFGASLTSDTTAAVGALEAERTIVFDIAGAQFQTNFPPGTDQASPFRGLYTQTIGQAIKSPVTEVPVAIA